MSEETRTTVTRFWEVVTFLATSFAFLLLGLKVNFYALVSFAPFVIAAFAAILFARAVSVYPIVALTRALGEKIPTPWTHLLAFAGLRGVLSVALALSLPESSFKELIVAMTFGVALFSIILQGELLNVWIRRAKL
jgi:CPA1 family monovalent cation:H+ antiporter